MSNTSLAHIRAALAEARAREQRFARMALQHGISPEQRFHMRQLQLSARAEVKLREKALAHAEGHTA